MGVYSLEHKERYDIIIGEEWYITVPCIQYMFVFHTMCHFCENRTSKV